MSDPMTLIITLRKPVVDIPEANLIAEFVKEKLQPHPDVDITAHVSNHLNLEDDPT